MPFYKRGVISKTGRETFFFISKIIHLHYNHSYFKGLLLFQFLFTVSWVFAHCLLESFVHYEIISKVRHRKLFLPSTLVHKSRPKYNRKNLFERRLEINITQCVTLSQMKMLCMNSSMGGSGL